MLRDDYYIGIVTLKDGVSKEVLQAEQKPIQAEQGTVERLKAAADYEIAEFEQHSTTPLLCSTPAAFPT
jgi:hypothetical protein